MAKLKGSLMSPPVLQVPKYESGRPLVITMDASPFAAHWAIGQDNEKGERVFNPEPKHIVGRDNLVANMLSRPRFKSSEGDTKVGTLFGEMEVGGFGSLELKEELYTGELLSIGRYIDTLKR
ncbi:unnamed protein product [Calypogeia fissa]